LPGCRRLSLDFDAILRRIKPDKRTAPLANRPDEAFVRAEALAGSQVRLLPDTNVYIVDAAGGLPTGVQDVLDRGLLFHCSVCFAELALGLAAYNPFAPGWAAQRNHYNELFDNVPPGRLLTPDESIWLTAATVAGVLARVQGRTRTQRADLLNDALIYLTAAKAGVPVLTGNRRDFDLIQQVAGIGQFLWF
jgi:predicted nucleic acid-binding protein